MDVCLCVAGYNEMGSVFIVDICSGRSWIVDL